MPVTETPEPQPPTEAELIPIARSIIDLVTEELILDNPRADRLRDLALAFDNLGLEVDRGYTTELKATLNEADAARARAEQRADAAERFADNLTARGENLDRAVTTLRQWAANVEAHVNGLTAPINELPDGYLAEGRLAPLGAAIVALQNVTRLVVNADTGELVDPTTMAPPTA